MLHMCTKAQFAHPLCSRKCISNVSYLSFQGHMLLVFKFLTCLSILAIGEYTSITYGTGYIMNTSNQSINQS